MKPKSLALSLVALIINALILAACSSSGDGGAVTDGAGGQDGPGMEGGQGSDSSSSDGSSETPDPPPAGSVPLPDGPAGIGFDDIVFSSNLRRIVVGAGRSGNVILVDPDSLQVTAIGGFSASSVWNRSDTQGPSTADEGDGTVFTIDRTTGMLSAMDPTTKAIVVSVAAGRSDYVRYVPSSKEVWVTSPGRGIDVYQWMAGGTPSITHTSLLTVGGPEGLTIDRENGRAYVHAGGGTVALIDIASHSVSATWAMGCSSNHGIPAVDGKRGLVLVGCGSTQVVAVDGAGKVLGSYSQGTGAPLMAYSPGLNHFYMRSDPGTKVAILKVDGGGITELGTADVPSRGHCLTADDRGFVWTCDWPKGELVRVRDPYPASP